MRGETEEVRKERWKGICGIQSCKVFEMAHVGKFEHNIITSDTYSNKWMLYLSKIFTLQLTKFWRHRIFYLMMVFTK